MWVTDGSKGAGKPMRGLLFSLVAMWAILAAVLGMGAPASASAAADGVPKDGRMSFEVLRGDDRIGEQTFQFTNLADGGLRVDIDVRIQVKLGFITVHRYQHQSTGIWQGGRLDRLTSSSVENKDTYALSVRRAGYAYLIDGHEGMAVVGEVGAPDTFVPTTYWNPETPNKSKLITTKRGAVLDMRVLPLGEARIDGPVGPITARGYELRADRKVKVYYDVDSGELVHMVFSSIGGEITYRRADPPGDDSLAAAR